MAKLSERLRGYFDPVGSNGRIIKDINEAAALLDRAEAALAKVVKAEIGAYHEAREVLAAIRSEGDDQHQ